METYVLLASSRYGLAPASSNSLHAATCPFIMAYFISISLLSSKVLLGQRWNSHAKVYVHDLGLRHRERPCRCSGWS